MQASEANATLLLRFPELSEPIKVLREDEGKEPGSYIVYEDIFRPFITYLLAAPVSDSRERVLRRAFDFIEELLADGGEVANLGFIALLEGQSNSWLQAAKPYLKAETESALEEFESRWRERSLREASCIEISLEIDLYGVKKVVSQITGTTSAA